MIDDIYQDGTDQVLADMVKRAPPKAPPSPPGFFAGSLAAAPQGIGSGVSKSLAFSADISNAFGSVMGAYPEAFGAQLTDEQKKQAETARNALLKNGPNYNSEAGDIMRQHAADVMPDPKTTGTAAHIIAGFAEFGSEVGAGAFTAGPLAPLFVGGTTGFDTADELQKKGVDRETAIKAGLVTGVTNAAMVGAPMGSVTRLGAAAKGLAVGEGTQIGQTAAVQHILDHGGYHQMASQYDPLDPVSLAVGAVPGVFGVAFHGGAPSAKLSDVVMGMESGGKRYGADGQLLTSPKGAQGEMQVMPATSRDPGFGVKPAADGSPEELARVGRDYLDAMQARYNNPEQAMAAYNAGPGAVDAAIKAHPADWLSHLPEETQNYVAKGRAKLGEAAVAANPDAVPAARVAQVQATIDATRLSADSDIAGANQHTAAIESAHDQIARGDRVDVSDQVQSLDPARVQAISDAMPKEAIERQEGLSPAEREVETAFADQVTRDPDAALKAYSELPETKGGKVVNTDEARALSEHYNASNESRATFARAVHEPASAIAKMQWQRLLAQPKETGQALFLAGGGGSGKTSSLEKVMPGFESKYDAIFDGTMANPKSAAAKIEEALASGREAHIVYTARDPHEAIVNGVIKRAISKGRTVPLDVAAQAHMDAPKSFATLADKYADDPRVKFTIIDNTGGAEDVRVTHEMPAFDYTDLVGRVKAAAEKAHEEGKISDSVRSGLLGSRETEAPRRGELGEEQPANSGTDGGAQAVDSVAEQIAAENPDLMVQLDGMEPMRVADLLKAIRDEAAEDKQEGGLLQAAVGCLLQHA